MLNKNVFILNDSSAKTILEIIYNSHNKCKLYSLNNGKLFQRKFDSTIQEININYLRVVDSDMEKVCNIIIDNVYSAFKTVPTIKTSNLEDDNYFEKFDGRVNQIVYSLVNKYWDNGNQIRFVAELLVRITHAHIFSNGNKRTALISAWKVLDFFGLYLKFSSNTETYISYWEDFMLNVSCWKEKEVREYKFSHLNEDELIDVVCQTITNNLLLKL